MVVTVEISIIIADSISLLSKEGVPGKTSPHGQIIVILYIIGI
jgi:hypothetical protein